jgi:hypothetical protein
MMEATPDWLKAKDQSADTFSDIKSFSCMNATYSYQGEGRI